MAKETVMTPGEKTLLCAVIIIAMTIMGCMFTQKYTCEVKKGGEFVRTTFWFTCLPKNYGVLHATE